MKVLIIKVTLFFELLVNLLLYNINLLDDVVI